MAMLDFLLMPIRRVMLRGVALLPAQYLNFTDTNVVATNNLALGSVDVSGLGGGGGYNPGTWIPVGGATPQNFAPTKGALFAVDCRLASVTCTLPTATSGGWGTGDWFRLFFQLGSPAANNVIVNAQGGATVQNPNGPTSNLQTYTASYTFNAAGFLGTSIRYEMDQNGNFTIQ